MLLSRSSSEKEEDGNAGIPPVVRWKRLLRLAERLLALGALVYILLVFSPVPDWVYDSMDCQDELRPAKYIICLGGDASRVIEAARLMQEGQGETLIVSNHEPASTMMRDMAIEWGAPAERIVIDDQSWTTRDHPRAVQEAAGIDPAEDTCIIVTNYLHMSRSRAVFQKAGYQHLVMREPRWERTFHSGKSNWRGRFKLMPLLLYEGAAWVEYWLRGVV